MQKSAGEAGHSARQGNLPANPDARPEFKQGHCFPGSTGRASRAKETFVTTIENYDFFVIKRIAARLAPRRKEKVAETSNHPVPSPAA